MTFSNWPSECSQKSVLLSSSNCCCGADAAIARTDWQKGSGDRPPLLLSCCTRLTVTLPEGAAPFHLLAGSAQRSAPIAACCADSASAPGGTRGGHRMLPGNALGVQRFFAEGRELFVMQQRICNNDKVVFPMRKSVAGWGGGRKSAI